MEKLIVLGTGNAMVTKCYNTCFALQKGEDYVLVDAGGGNGILAQLTKAKVPFTSIRHLIVTHAHCDHLLVGGRICSALFAATGRAAAIVKPEIKIIVAPVKSVCKLCGIFRKYRKRLLV